MCSSVCDHDAAILSNQTESKKVITDAVQPTIQLLFICEEMQAATQ
jgi:hypothetical protein